MASIETLSKSTSNAIAKGIIDKLAKVETQRLVGIENLLKTRQRLALRCVGPTVIRRTRNGHQVPLFTGCYAKNHPSDPSRPSPSIMLPLSAPRWTLMKASRLSIRQRTRRRSPGFSAVCLRLAVWPLCISSRASNYTPLTAPTNARGHTLVFFVVAGRWKPKKSSVMKVHCYDPAINPTFYDFATYARFVVEPWWRGAGQNSWRLHDDTKAAPLLARNWKPALASGLTSYWRETAPPPCWRTEPAFESETLLEKKLVQPEC